MKDRVDQVLEAVQANPPNPIQPLGANFPVAMKDFMEAVGLHESKGKYDAIQDIDKRVLGKKVPWPGIQPGAGKGYFQYEVATKGGSGANKTAIQRARNLYNKFGFKGDWIDDLMNGPVDPKDIDFSKLSEDKQKVLFIADKYYEKNISLKGIEDAYLAPDSTKHKEYARLWGEGHKRAKTRSDYEYDLINDHGYKHLRGAN